MSDQPADTLGARIVEARRAADLTSSELARRMGIRHATLKAWEQGRSGPRTNRLVTLAGILGVSPGWLLAGQGAAPTLASKSEEITALQANLEHLRGLRQSMDEQVAVLEQRVETLKSA